MRMSQEEKERSYVRIVASAAKLIRQHGMEGASVNDVMRDAGMTHGGFYKHFDSKEELVSAALDKAFAEIVDLLGPEPPEGDEVARATGFRSFYLSDEHVASPSLGCPVAALSGDVARASAPMKMRFGAGVRRIVTLLARGDSGSQRVRRARAARQLAMMAGAVMIARASDDETARQVLAACGEYAS